MTILAAQLAGPAAPPQLPSQPIGDADDKGTDDKSAASVRPTRKRFAWVAAALVVLALLGIGSIYALPLTVENLVEIVLERLEQLKTLSSSFWNVWD